VLANLVFIIKWSTCLIKDELDRDVGNHRVGAASARNCRQNTIDAAIPLIRVSLVFCYFFLYVLFNVVD